MRQFLKMNQQPRPPVINLPCRNLSTSQSVIDSSTESRSAELRISIDILLRAALVECSPPGFIEDVRAQHCLQQANTVAQEDLAAFVSKDPAARESPTYILLGYTSYKAVLHYRLAHAFIVMSEREPAHRAELEAHALILSSRGKLLSGAEIHPRCEIGRRFVLDHGWGTVIGETTRIGDDCYVLGGVTLGATGIANNPSGKRHPTLGNRVQIGAFARVLGDIHIGNDVFVGAHCSITESIPPDSIVTLRSQTQVSRLRNTVHAHNTTEAP